MSQNFDIGPRFDFMLKNGKICYFCIIIFLDFIKSKLRPKYKK